MEPRERYRRQFEKCFRKSIPTGTPKPLTGIEKELEEQREAERLWRELENRDR